MIPAATAALGALAGSQRQGSTSSVQLAPPSASELAGEQAITANLPILQQLINAGAGQQDITSALGASRGLGDLLSQYAQGGFLPGESDFATARQFATSAFAPQQVALNQQFEEEKQRAAQLAAQLGRPVNDPIIQAKLSQERMRSQERLGAAQSSFVSEFAQSLPQQRLQYTGQLADVRNQLASQAMANRQALIGIGSQLQQAGQQFRAGTATRTQESGGGLLGGLTGALGGASAGFGLRKLLGGSPLQAETEAPSTAQNIAAVAAPVASVMASRQQAAQAPSYPAPSVGIPSYLAASGSPYTQAPVSMPWNFNAASAGSNFVAGPQPSYWDRFQGYRQGLSGFPLPQWGK